MRISAAVLVFLLSALPVSAQPQKPPTSADFAALTAQLNALTARVAKLESGAITTTDIVGTWLIVSRGIAMHSNPPSVGEDFTTATFRFQSDGTGAASLTGANSTLVQQ